VKINWHKQNSLQDTVHN